MKLRKCQACGKIQDDELMIKITYNKKDNEIKVNPNSKFFGRSCYVCKNKDCLEKFIKKKRIFGGLKIKNIKNEEEIFNSIKNLVE